MTAKGCDHDDGSAHKHTTGYCIACVQDAAQDLRDAFTCEEWDMLEAIMKDTKASLLFMEARRLFPGALIQVGSESFRTWEWIADHIDEIAAEQDVKDKL